ncbi:MAG TPA: hypothetical protein ENN76_03230, partial [Euryarchaeota archaeon]|nr:hypothetical protein [Euryarchaeota archaeon]
MVRKSQGGDEALRSMLEELRRFLFSGYVKVDVERDNGNILGFVVLNTGVPTACYKEVSVKRKKDIFKGTEALEALLDDTGDKNSILEIHGKVDIDQLEETFSDSVVTEKDLEKLGLTYKVKRKKETSEDKRIALSWGIEDKIDRFK